MSHQLAGRTLRRLLARTGWAVGIVAAALLTVGVMALPQNRSDAIANSTMPPEEYATTLAALRAPKRTRPVVAVLAHNDGTETTDLIVPFGVLTAADTADVAIVALRDAPITLMPVLRVQPTMTTAAFDARHPDGADYVIVPAMHTPDAPLIVAWVRAQAASGAIVVGICDGAWVLGAAGLLDDHRATTHWFSAAGLRRTYPRMQWATDRRYVVDRHVMTTTGISASIPASLALVEAMAGPARAAALAATLGVSQWGPSHTSAHYRLDRGAVLTAARNLLAFWSYDTVSLDLHDGIDEVALALTADAFARTYRTTVRTVTTDGRAVVTRHGLRVLADASAESTDPLVTVPTAGNALGSALAMLTERYGAGTADFVALQLESPR